MANGSYMMGTGIQTWKQGVAQTITFVVTEDCNLRCKYCYITHKCSDKRMTFDVAKKFIDYVLSDQIDHAPAVVVEFIGGEPFLEVELIDQISDYFKRRAFELRHPWYWNYRFNFSTNGINYGSEAVQNYLNKNEGKVSVGITIDGTREKHDLQRVFPDGSGSYDKIIPNIPNYIRRFVPATKVTFASDDLVYLKDSIIDLWSKGITEVSANVVFEDAWKEGDEAILEEQLKGLADYALDNRLFETCRCSFFDEGIGGYLAPEALDKTSCGAGKMMAVGPEGDIYPCIRYKAYSLNNRKEWVLGNVDNGIDMEKVRPFIATSNRYQSDIECLECPIANGCAHCQGFKYDCADTDTNFYRAKFICGMNKARVRANEYYFAQLWKRYGIRRKRKGLEKQQLMIPLAGNYISWCCYRNVTEDREELSVDRLKAALRYCADHFMEAVLVHPSDRLIDVSDLEELYLASTRHMVPARFYREAVSMYENVLPVFEKDTLGAAAEDCPNCIFNIEQRDIAGLSEMVCGLLQKSNRVNVNIHGLDMDFDEETYRGQLLNVEEYLADHQEKEVNLITDRVYLEVPDNCKAGTRSFTMNREGSIYPCVGMMEEGMEEAAGSIADEKLLVKGERLYHMENHPICRQCDAYQCRNCMYRNKKATKELCVSPSWQCRKAHIEREVSRIYQEDTQIEGTGIIGRVEYLDPMEALPEVKGGHGFYFKYQGQVKV